MAAEVTLIQSVVRALELLDLVGSSDSPVTAKYLARRAGLSLGTTYDLLRTLVHEGYLHRDSGGYRVGFQVTNLTGAARETAERIRARALLEALHLDVRAPVYSFQKVWSAWSRRQRRSTSHSMVALSP